MPARPMMPGNSNDRSCECGTADPKHRRTYRFPQIERARSVWERRRFRSPRNVWSLRWFTASHCFPRCRGLCQQSSWLIVVGKGSVLLGLMATDIAGIARDNHDTSIDAISDAAEPPPLGIGFHRSRRKGKGAERDSEAEDQKAVLKTKGNFQKRGKRGRGLRS